MQWPRRRRQIRAERARVPDEFRELIKELRKAFPPAMLLDYGNLPGTAYRKALRKGAA